MSGVPEINPFLPYGVELDGVFHRIVASNFATERAAKYNARREWKGKQPRVISYRIASGNKRYGVVIPK